MARVNVDSQALTDARFAVLAGLMGVADPDYALGKMVRLWNQCIERETYVVTKPVIVALFGGASDAPDWLLKAELAEQDDSGLRIKGTRGRIEYLAEKRAKARENGLKGGRPSKKPTSVTKKPTSVPMETPLALPLALPPSSLSLRERTRTRRGRKSVVSGTEFKPPTLDEVRVYCVERGKGVDADAWLNYYTANGWMVGKNRMIDWQASVRIWERNGVGAHVGTAAKSDEELKARYGSKAKGGE